MTAFMRAAALQIMLPWTRWSMYLTWRLLRADNDAFERLNDIRYPR